ncbi:alpha/beta hydrolase family protein [Gymnodinialimonas sp.]
MDILAETARMAPIYETGHPLHGATDVINTQGVQAYIMSDHSLLIPGTNAKNDWWSFNLQFGTVLGSQIGWAELESSVGTAKWYRGFAKHARILYLALNGWKPKRIIGHSLGGASAQILGAFYGVPTLSLAAPRPRKGSAKLKKEGWVLNITYEKDLIQAAPPYEFGYRYVGSSRIMKAVAGSSKALHSPTDYYPIVQRDIASGRLPAQWPP